MWEYHDDGIRYLRSHDHCGLFDEPGLGKTRQLLLAAEGRTLLLAPAFAIDGGVYDDELTKWRPDLDLTQVPYSSLNERERTQKGGTRPTAKLRPEFKGHWDTVICDEAHYLKNRKTKWTEATFKITADRWYLATGTPIPNWAYELFTTLQLLYPEHAKPGGKFGSYWRWAREWFHVGPTHWSPMEVGEPLDGTDEGWLRFNEENLGERYLLRTWEQVLPQVPPMRFQQILCPMGEPQRKAYRQLKKDYVTWTDTGAEIEAWSSAGLHVKLARLTTGLQLLDPSVPARGASGKFDMVRDQVMARPGEQIFMVCHFRPTSAALERLVADECDRSVLRVDGGVSKQDRVARMRAFKDGKVDVLVATIDTVAEAFSFERCHTVMRVERSWRPTKNKQVADRIRRISELSPKLCLDFVTPDSVDARMLPVLEKKTDQQIKAMRAREFAALL